MDLYDDCAGMKPYQSIMIGGIYLYIGFLAVLYVAEVVTRIRKYFNTPKNGDATMRANENFHKAMGKVNQAISNGTNLTKKVLKRAKGGAQIILQKLGLIKKKFTLIEYFKKKKDMDKSLEIMELKFTVTVHDCKEDIRREVEQQIIKGIELAADKLEIKAYSIDSEIK